MQKKTILDNQTDRDTGFRVPDGYFDDVRKQITARLPERSAEEPVSEMTVWQRVRPYIYMAAMFAGIWCMMKLFHDISGAGRLSLDNPPEAVAEAIMEYNPAAYYMDSDIDDFQLESEIAADYSSIEDFSKDFGYEFSLEYAVSEVAASSQKRQKQS